MASRRSLSVLSILCAVGAAGAALPLAGSPTSAGPDAASPRITRVRIHELSAVDDSARCREAAGSERIQRRAPKATTARAASLVQADVSCAAKVTFRLALLGENLAPTAAAPEILLDTEDPGHPVQSEHVTTVSNQEIDVSGEVALGTIITAVKLTVGGRPVPTPDGLTISFKASPPAAELKEFPVKFEPRHSKEFPNLHSLLVTRQGGGSGVAFDVRPNRMRVDLEPAGATDLSIVRGNEEQIELHFVAAADYVPTNVAITVYDGSDLDLRKVVAVGKAKPPAPHEDRTAPQITDVQMVFLDRGLGNGRIRVYGRGFGKHDPPGYPVDDYLCDCLERPESTGYRPCAFLDDFSGPIQVSRDAKGREMIMKDRALREQKAISDRAMLRNRSARHEALKGKFLKEGETQKEDDTAPDKFCTIFQPAWAELQTSLLGNLTVNVNSRDAAIRVERAYIIDINDEMIDIYFEFTRHPGYAWPFRLAGVDLALTREVKNAEQKVKAKGVSGEVEVAASEAVSAAFAIGPQADPNLAYQYTILDGDAAKSLFGDGVADNFYVLQLSVVNNGTKKFVIPLAAVQAEVEWLYGWEEASPGKKAKRIYYLEGPPTLAPVPLAAVSAYFGMYQKAQGRRTRLFNVLEGITTLATTLVPFTGSALKDAEVVFSGGFIPGLRQAYGDLSAQQLQNLTSLSWEASETVAANGGSIEKYIYIQRRTQFSDEWEPTTNSKTMKQISNIMALEVSGFEVPDAPAKQAVPARRKAPAAPATSDPAW